MSENIFLQEMPATAVYFDVRQFSSLVVSLGPVDLGVALSTFYRHVEQAVLAHEGRIVRFVSDAVLCLFPSVGGVDHAGRALRLVQTLVGEAPRWCLDNIDRGLPAMEYSMGVASGTVLYGELGTPRQRTLDALGRPVSLAARLARLATARQVSQLIAVGTIEATREQIPVIEVEAVEFGGELVRLYRVLTAEEAAQAAAPGRAE